MSKYPGVNYYSASKKQNIPIEDLNPSHLLNAAKKLRANIEDLEVAGLPVNAESRELMRCMDAEIHERGLDTPKPEAP